MNISEKDIPTTYATLELLYNVSRELAAALDLRTVLERVLFLSMKNVQAISGSILVLDDNGQPIESAIIIGDKVHDQMTQQLRITFERGLAGWVTRNRQAVLVSDTSQDERWLLRPDDAKDQTGAKSAVSAPILTRDQLIGVITLVNPSPGYYKQEHLALVKAIADQAGIAVLNARLYAESQRQARVMTALADSAAFITASLKLDDVLQRILEQISQVLRVQVVTLALIDSQTQELVFHASTDKKDQSVVGMRMPLGRGVAGWVAKEGRGAVVNDVNNDPRFYPNIDQTVGFTTRAIACAPIRSRGQVIGVLEALNPLDGIFDPDALFVLTGIGSLAGTAIRHAQLFERLDAAHQRYRELFEDSIDPILITDWKGDILEANRQVGRITGIEDETLKNMRINNLHVVDQDIVGTQFKNLSSGRACSYETNLVTPSGHEIPVQVHARQVFIDGVSHLQWILRDITERNNLDSLRNDLISMIYHDLRSPLANVVSSLDVMAAMLPSEIDPSFKSLLEIAIRSTERIQRLTNSLLDIRRLEAGQEIGDRQLITPFALAKEAIEAVNPIAKNKSQEISVDIPPELPEVSVDTDMIRRVLINLLENAVKYTPQGSKIYISAQESGNWMQFCVQDNGPGIPPAEHERVFDKFARLQTKNGPKGLGLGLAYCRLAVESHNGKIWVENVPDSGARFKFVLPIVSYSQETAVPSR
jgi:NtrC-family two-component system sensor histidine kinase KinB